MNDTKRTKMVTISQTFWVVIIRQEEPNYSNYGEVHARVVEREDLYKVGEGISDGVSSQGVVKAILPVEWRDAR